MNRLTLLPLLALAALLSACGGDEAAPARATRSLADQLPQQSDMNVLIVSFDALRADALGLYGNARELSPNLDRFAEQALVFNRAYSAAPVTPTSFASAFTGKWPFRVFLGWNLVAEHTLAEELKKAGLFTWGFFNNTQVVAERNFDKGFDQYEVVHLTDEEVLTEAKKRISAAADRQFYGWVHFISPHSPYDYREMAAHLYDPDYTGPWEKTTGHSFLPTTRKDLDRLRDLYDGEVLFLDYLFADLMAHVEALGLAEKTMIIVTADHGEEFMDHGQMQHNAVYEETIRIPFIVRHPNGKPGRTDIPYTNVDLMPTVMSLLGISHELVLDGVDLTAPHAADRLILATGMTHGTDRHYSATGGLDKLIVDCKPEYEEALFDLEADPGEKVDLIRETPDVAERLIGSAAQTAGGEPCDALQRAIANSSPLTNLSEEQIERLKSLGYIQ